MSSSSAAGFRRTWQEMWQENAGKKQNRLAVLQEAGDRDGAWVHAYLHRKEGDEMNAGYWYARAGRPAATGDLQAEWEAIVRKLLRAHQKNGLL